MSLTNIIIRPSFANMRGPDALQLVATGMCFGVAIATLVGFLRGDRST